jgi:DNA-binding transcriptional LysR family regulator
MQEIGLDYLCEAAALGSMRLASDKLGVAVSTISRQVSQLERDFGLPLFERGRRSIRLTAAGQLALEYHKARIADHEALINRMRELQESRTGEVHLAVGEGFLGLAFSEAIDEFQALYPGVMVTIQSGSSAEVMETIAQDDAHIGLVFNPEVHPKIRARASVGQPLMLICAPTHPLAAETQIDFATLASYPLCLPPRNFRIRLALAEVEAREQCWLQAKLVTSSIQAMRGAAKFGTLATILPPISVLSELEAGELVARPIRGKLAETRIELVHRLSRKLDGPPGRMMALLETKVKNWRARTS